MDLRLFIGLELPQSCKKVLGALDPRLPGLRWISKEQLHLTMSFLGNVGPLGMEALLEALSHVKVPPFFLPLEGTGIFNAHGRPSTVWVGVGRGHPHLFALHKRIQDAVISAGIEPDLKAFLPHVTIGRARDLSKEALQPFLRKHAKTEHGLFQVSRFILFSSRPGLAMASHSLEAAYEL